MKKITTYDEVGKMPYLLKLFRVMKITCLLIMITLVQVSASSYSQSAKLTFNLKNATLSDVFENIEKSSEFRFFYDTGDIDLSRKVSITADDSKIDEILNSVFKDSDISYEIFDRYIVIKNNKKEENSIKKGFFQLEQKNITGSVTDLDGLPLPGVTVLVKGTTLGTVTNSDGDYSLSNVSADAILVFSFVGMRSQEVKVENKDVIDVQLEIDAIGIEEVVAIGYGTMKRANLTGSVSSVSSQAISRRATNNPTNLLQGRIAGLQVTQPSGQPGKDDAIFQIRGMGSFGASSSPLVLINGIAGSLSNLAPNDIEEITVLKDAASASIYGSRAANGVILVTTKEAKGSSLEYQLDVGVHNATRLPELITNSAEYMEMYNSAMQRSGNPAVYTQAEIDAYRNATDRNEYPNFDWLDYYFNPAKAINHYLSLSNVGQTSTYKFSLNYLDQDGVLPNIHYKKYNAQLNFTNKITKAIKVGTNMNAVLKDNHEPPGWSDTNALSVYQHGPTYKPYLPDGSGRKTAWAYPSEGHNSTAPVAFSNGARYTKDYAFYSQVYADVNLYKGLTWTVKAAVNYADNTVKDHIYKTQEHYFYHKLPGESDYSLNPVVTAPVGIGVSDRYSKIFKPSLYSILNYDATINTNHNLHIMLGYEQESYKYQYLAGSRKEFPVINLMELDAGSSNGQSLGGSAYEYALRSYFARFTYNFKGKYLLEANSRYDGTSRVSKENRWGFFPSFSAGWRVSEEGFVKDKLSWLSNLKLRASYGVLGNQEIGNYPYQDLLSLTSYPFGGSIAQGVLLTRLTDKNLKWESTKVLDFGIDMDVQDGLFGMTFDWYKKTTFDILATKPVPSSLGLSGPITNDGKLQNKGIDLELRHGKTSGDFRYNVNFILSTFKNELLSIVTETKGIREVGLPYNSFYLYEMEGIFKSQEDIDNSAQHVFYSVRPGDIKIKDQNGDDIIDKDDRVSISPYPEYTYSVGLNAGWKRFNLSVFLQGVQGLRTQIYGWGYDPFVQGDSPSVRFRDAWSPTNPDGKEPAVYIGSGSPTGGYSGVYGYPSTYHLPDASYLRLKNVNLSYDIPKTLVNKLKLQDLTIYVSGDNLLTITKFPGIDPELPSSSTRGSAYPQVRILNLGIKVKL